MGIIVDELDYVGKSFGRLTVLSLEKKLTVTDSRPEGRRDTYATCVCTCGKTLSTRIASLNNGKTTSCGCFGKEKRREACLKSGRKTPEYRIWSVMKGRCHNPNDKKYPMYGARGIVVCEEWRSSFDSFIRDMGPRPSSKHSIDRIDNNGSYTPENCRWTTIDVQAKNTRRNRYVEVNGVSMIAKDAAVLLGVPISTAHWRLRNGKTIFGEQDGSGQEREDITKGIHEDLQK